MATRTKPKGRRSQQQRSYAPGLAMASPYASEVALHSAAAFGGGVTAAAAVGLAGATAYGAARHREHPSRRARRDLRTAARSGSPTSRSSRAGGRAGGVLGSKSPGGSSKRAAGSRSGSGLLGSKSAAGGSKRAAGGKAGGTGGRKAGAGVKTPAKPAGKAAGKAAGSRSPGTGGKAGGSSAGASRKRTGPAGTPFGRGPRGSAARSMTAGKKKPGSGAGGFFGGKSKGKAAGPGAGSGKGGSPTGGKRSGGLLGRKKGTTGTGGGTSGKGGGLFGRKKGTTGTGGGKTTTGAKTRTGARSGGLSAAMRRTGRTLAGRRKAATSAAAHRRAQQPRGTGRQQWKTSKPSRTIARSWSPVRRLWGRQRNAGSIAAAGRGIHLLTRSGAALVGTLVGLVMFTPKFLRLHRSAGLALGRRVQIIRSAVAGWVNPYEQAQYERMLRTKIRPRLQTGGGTSTGGNVMAQGTADHAEALIEQIRSAGTVDKERLSGVGAAAHAEAMGRVVEALAEWANANMDVLREGLPQLDGGESLAQQVNVISSAASAARECGQQFEAVHEDRLRRQREPEAGEQAWDVSAARD